MRVNLSGDEQVARRTTVFARSSLALQAHAAAIDSTGGHLHRVGVGLALAGNAHGDALLRAVERFVERHVQRHVHILAATGLRLAAKTAAEVPVAPKRTFTVANALQNVGPTAAEAAGPTATEDILDVKALATAPSLGDLVLVRRAVLVVKRALLLVA